MKKIKFYLSFLAVFALLLTSCSKDEDTGTLPDSDKATLSFGAIVQDLANKSANKQSELADIPVCVEDAPAYVEIVLMQGENEIAGSLADPFRVDLVEGQLFTEEVPELELEPGNYSLEHFSVYNAEGDLIWLAPKGGVLAEFVDNALPLNISLGAGVKKYVDVSVLCFDDRDVNEYGYMFFELDANKAFEYCFFANYCTPEGRHWPARFSVEISIDGQVLYTADENTNNGGQYENGDFYAEPICFALPDLDEYADDEAYIDYVLTLEDWDGAYGDVDQMVIEGSLSRNDVVANFDGEENVYYDHQRFGCDEDGEEPLDSDGDGVVDSEDDCPDEAGPADNNGCPVEEPDGDGDGVVDSADNCPDVSNPDQTDTDGDGMGDACDLDDDNDGVNDDDDDCELVAGPADNNGCPVQETDTDGDGVIDTEDNCPNIANADQTDSDGDGVGDVCDNDVEVCEMNSADAGCDEAWLEGVQGFVQVDNNLPLDLNVGETFIGAVKVDINEEGNLTILTELIASANFLFSDYEIWVSTTSDQSNAIASACGTVDPGGTLEVDLGDIDAEYGYYIHFNANVCPATE